MKKINLIFIILIFMATIADAMIIGWGNKSSTITRTSTGKLFYENFSGDLSQWTTSHVEINSGSLRLDSSATVGGYAYHTFSPTISNPLYISFKRYDTSTNRHTSVGPMQSDFNEYDIGGNASGDGLFNDAGSIVTPIAGTLQSESYTGDWRAYCFSVTANLKQLYRGTDASDTNCGNEVTYTMDDTYTGPWTYIFLRPAKETQAVGSLIDNVAVCSSYNITVTGLASGYKARIGGASGKVATASGGTATVDCRGLTFPQSTVEILDASDNIISSLTLTNDVWGGDSFH